MNESTQSQMIARTIIATLPDAFPTFIHRDDFIDSLLNDDQSNMTDTINPDLPTTDDRILNLLDAIDTLLTLTNADDLRAAYDARFPA
jgi:hypothetical protein